MNFKFTKIISTIGPATHDKNIIKNLIINGADVFRINFSHGTYEEHSQAVKLIRDASKEVDKIVTIFIDLQGPKIRIGDIENDNINLKNKESFIITTEKIIGNSNIVSIDYPDLHNEIKAGDRILIDDGNIELIVEKIENKKIFTVVKYGGILKPHKGVNLPTVKLKQISSVTEKDINDLDFAFQFEIDYVALSFVRSVHDIENLINLMKNKYNRIIPIISKIETPQAINDIDNIIEISEAVMVARGDLGVETSNSELPIIQKEIIRKCNFSGTPVITATQMLESMVSKSKPTRAEANDVANSILDGSDAIMLSEETAIGNFPIESVLMMKDIAIKTEASQIYKKQILNLKNIESYASKMKIDTAEAVGFAAVELAYKINAKYILALTISGSTAKLVSKYKPDVPIIAFSPIQSIVNKLALVWGIIPFLISDLASFDCLIDEAIKILKKNNYLKENDSIVITAGIPLGWPGKTNILKVVKI